MKKYIWVLSISNLNNEPRILIDAESFIFDSEKSAKVAMSILHGKVSCKENCKMINETDYPQKGFSFVRDELFYGVQVIKKQVVTDANKLNTGYSVFI
jgi:hypothetical protein